MKKVHFGSSRLLSSLSARAPPDDACCQGDRYNPGDRPFLWAAPCDWPMDRGRGGSADWAVLIGWLAGLARGRSPGRVSVASIDLIGWQAGRQSAHTHTHTHTHTDTHRSTQRLAGWRCKGKFGPVGVTSVGASVCVCNIMLSRRGVAGSNRSTPRSRPRWVISHSLGNSPYTHTQTHTHTHLRIHTHTHGAKHGTYGPCSERLTC